MKFREQYIMKMFIIQFKKLLLFCMLSKTQKDRKTTIILLVVLYGWNMVSYIEGRIYIVSENTILKKIFRPKKWAI
jgi:hypothetical protein